MDTSNLVENHDSSLMPAMAVRESLQCSICFMYLREPVLTICGHRFCEKCLSKWLNERGNRCPIDSRTLKSTDIFPDNYTKREIAGLSVICPNEGCFMSLPVTEFEEHYENCTWKLETQEKSTRNKCLYFKIGCDFESETPLDMAAHQSSDVISHTQLLLLELAKLGQHVHDCQCSGPNDEYLDCLKGKIPFYLNDVYAKLTELDQRTKEYAIELNNVTSKLKECLVEINHTKLAVRETMNGRLLWRIQKIDEMVGQFRKDPNFSLLSGIFRTSDIGYRFRMRLKFSRETHALSVLIYLVRGAHDFILKWPFVGDIVISIMHPLNPNLHLKSVIKANGSEAFQRPIREINTKGFGFSKTVTLTELTEGGYLRENELIIFGSVKSDMDL